MSTTRRPRKKNFSQSETLTLIELYSANKEVLQSKFKSSVTNQAKQKAWSDITDAVNSVSLIGRTTSEIKEKWSKLSSEARIQLRARKYPPTGNVKVTEMPELDIMSDIFGNSSLIEGVAEGGIDTGEQLQQDSAPSMDPMPEVNDVKNDESVNLQLSSGSRCDDAEPPIQSAGDTSSVNKSRPHTPSISQPSRQSTTKTGRRAEVRACDELYAKYLKISIEVKELKKEKLQMEIENLKRNSTCN